MTLTDKLDLLLKENGLNRKEFSRQSGIPYMTIVNFYEKGTENVKLSTLKKIAKFFDVSLDYIADDSVSEKSPYQNNLFAGTPDDNPDDTEKLIHKTFQTMDVKTKLSELLEEKGMKQADLSRITGIPTSLISNYLNGIKSPSLSNAVALATALNVTVDDLAGLSSDDVPSFKDKGLMIGDKIKNLRKASNMTQLDLAKKLGVTRTVISNWEANINKPNIDLVANMCKTFCVSPDYFFETKKSSDPVEPESEEDFRERVQLLTAFFERSGYITPGGDITHEQLKICKAFVDFLDSYFSQP